MNKEKVIAWIEGLEDMADQSDKYFVERNELYRENQLLKERIGYLERSNNRREDEIISLREELVPIKKEVLQQRRDNAIEYLKCALSEDKETPSKYKDWRLDLLEILGDDSND